MKEKLDRLAKGIVDTEVPEPAYEPENWEETITAGVPSQYDIYVTSRNGMRVKGLVYSTHPSVRLAESSFGGLRNRLHFEVDTDHLESGDQIQGAFCFVTNGGEKKLPYSFRVENAGSAGLLSQMETVQDFARLAMQDWNTAQRLLDYRDFLDAPFLQDLHVRAVYEGLRGGPDRGNTLEEFLVAIGAKKPVEVYISGDTRVYERPETAVDDTIKIAKVGWGYLSVELKAQGDFIRLNQKNISREDFAHDWIQTPYRIDPSFLHPGRNFGRICLTTVRTDTSIEIEARGAKAGSGEESLHKDLFHRYLSQRLDYESGQYDKELLLSQMLKELETLSRDQIKGKGLLFNLLLAEAYLISSKKDHARLFLEESREHVFHARTETDGGTQAGVQFFYRYLLWLYEPKPGQKETLIDQVRHVWADDQKQYHLFFLLMKLDDHMKLNPAGFLKTLEEVYACGCKSPFLYQEACLILRQEPGLLKRLGAFERQILNMALKRGLMTSDLARTAAQAAMHSRHYHPLTCRILMQLYQKYQERSILEAVCCTMIKGELRRDQDFEWYEMALKAGINLTRLYEYYLYTLPENYGHLMPREVLIYFSYEKSLDQKSRAVLYRNLLKYCPDTDPLYQAYEREMEQFSMEQLFQSRINARLAVIYQHMLYRDVVDDRMARVLPSILHAYRVECRLPQMRSVIVCYEELKGEDIYPLQDNIAYVPVFSSHSVLLFQDAFGNRYGNVRHTRIPVMMDAELEKRCFEVYPEHPMLRLKACREILDSGTMNADQAYVLEQAVRDMDLHPLFRKKLMTRMVDYYQEENVQGREGEPGYGGQFLVQLDKTRLNRQERLKVCESLIVQGYYKEAFSMVKEYGSDGIRPALQFKLCSRMITEKMFDEDRLLMRLAWGAFEAGQRDHVVLDYLCEYFNGMTGQMYEILTQGIKAHVDTYDMEERLLDQMLFSGETERMDHVFKLYTTRKQAADFRVRAYLTARATEYFMEEKTVKTSVFDYLQKQVKQTGDMSKVPTIYLLALTSHYAELPALNAKQGALCRECMEYLLGEHLLFAYFKRLAGHVQLPDSVMNQVILQYRGNRSSRVELKLRVTPCEQSFRREDMRRVFQGFFICQKTLFDGEVLEYQIDEIQVSGRRIHTEGSITSEDQTISSRDRRFMSLNTMERYLRESREQELKEQMKEYLVYAAAAQRLFDIR